MRYIFLSNYLELDVHILLIVYEHRSITFFFRMCLMSSPSLARVRHWSCPDPPTSSSFTPLVTPRRRCLEAEDLLPRPSRRLAAWEETVLRHRQEREGKRRARVELAMSSTKHIATESVCDVVASPVELQPKVTARVPDTCTTEQRANMETNQNSQSFCNGKQLLEPLRIQDL